MDVEYDAIILGTGLKECILSGLLSVSGLKVLHIDRNSYYGGDSASLSLNQLWQKFHGTQDPPAALGASRDYNVDMVPKFMMANGLLVKVLLHTDVVKYMEFKAVDGSFVLSKGKIHKVPASDMEALKSPLMGLFEKRRARNFFLYVQDYKAEEPKTHKGYDLNRMTMAELFKAYDLNEDTTDFIGHSIALHRDDSYLQRPAIETVNKIQLYNCSLFRYEGLNAPYLYPRYGLGELPQSFARLSAVHGGTYMLNKPDVQVVFGSDGVATGVSSEGETAVAKMVVGDPSYFPGKTRVVGKVVRCICFLSHPIPDTNNGHSVQIILPQKQIGRHSDMYVFCSSYAHNVAPNGKYIAFVSTTVETANPEAELAPGLALLGVIDEKFVEVYDIYEPLEDGSKDKCFISKGYDATTHFETTIQDVLDMYKRITGKDLDLSKENAAVEEA